MATNIYLEYRAPMIDGPDRWYIKWACGSMTDPLVKAWEESVKRDPLNRRITIMSIPPTLTPADRAVLADMANSRRKAIGSLA